MHSGIRAAGCGGPSWRARHSRERLLDDQLDRPPLGLSLPSAEVRAVELDDEEKWALH